MATFYNGVFEQIEDFIFSRRDDAPTLEQETPPPVIESVALEPAGTMSMPLGAPPLVPLQDRIDVEAILDYAGVMEGGDLNWRTSVADLLTVCGIDPTPDSLQALAQEVGAPANDEQALLRAVMRELEDRGGDIPSEFK